MGNVIEPDEQLIFECKTFLPKIGMIDAHNLTTNVILYTNACKEGDIEKVKYWEIGLRKKIHKARMELCKNQ